MQRNLWRALLLAMTVLLIGALPVLAQSSDEGRLLKSDEGSVLVGIQNDVALASGEVEREKDTDNKADKPQIPAIGCRHFGLLEVVTLEKYGFLIC